MVRFRKAPDETPPLSSTPLSSLRSNRPMKIGRGGMVSCVMSRPLRWATRTSERRDLSSFSICASLRPISSASRFTASDSCAASPSLDVCFRARNRYWGIARDREEQVKSLKRLQHILCGYISNWYIVFASLYVYFLKHRSSLTIKKNAYKLLEPDAHTPGAIFQAAASCVVSTLRWEEIRPICLSTIPGASECFRPLGGGGAQEIPR